MFRNLTKRLHGGHFGHALPDLEAMLPDSVAGRSLATWSARGAHALEATWLGSDEVAELGGRLASDGLAIDDLEIAVAGPSDGAADPPYVVSAFRFRMVPAERFAPEIGVEHPTAGAWTPLSIGIRKVRIGTEGMVGQTEHLRGRPYVYDVGDVRFVVTTDDPAWAAEAIARLRPDPLVEHVPLLVGLPQGWRPGIHPRTAGIAEASAYRPDCIAAAYDATRLDQVIVPTLRIESGGPPEPGADAGAWLDDQEAALRSSMSLPQPGRRVLSVDRVELPAGEALRVELTSDPGSVESVELGVVRYLIPTEIRGFDLLFACAASDIAGCRATFDHAAVTFLRADLYPDDYLDRFTRVFVE